MAPGYKARQRAREKAWKAEEKMDPLTETVMLLLSMGWETAGMTSQETKSFPSKSRPGETTTVIMGGRRRFILPKTPRICTVGGKTTCFYKLDGDLKPIDLMTVPTKDLDEVRRIAEGIQPVSQSSGGIK